MRFLGYVCASYLAQIVLADWQFRSRPDLSPPKLNITTPAHGATESGYIFVAPYAAFTPGSWGPQQSGGYIFKDDGDLVWSSVGRLGGWVANFRPTEHHGKPMLQAFEGVLDAAHGRMYGKHSLLNEKYEIVKTVVAANHRLVSVHEFHITKDNTVLIETPLAVPTDLRRWGGKGDQQWVVSNGFQELNLDTGELLFEWFSLDHASADPAYSAFPLREDGNDNGRNSSDAWNYFHINSVDKDDEGNFLISARNSRAIFKINGKTGDVIWKLGGLHGSNFTIPKNVEFAFQHDARFRSRSEDGTIEVISFFDNAAHTAPGWDLSTLSRGRYVQLNHTSGEATGVATFPAPFGLSAQSQGNNQLLPNGNVFINWGQAGAVTEFAWDGEVLFHAFLDSEPAGQHVQSYRGFRANWTGTPSEAPAVVALRSTLENEVGLAVYVTWNGDTETAVWRFYSENTADGVMTKSLLGEAARETFETKLDVEKHAAQGLSVGHRIYAEAVDKHGRVLVSSRAVAIKDEVIPRSRASPLAELKSQISEGRFDLK